ncbi:MAG: hypothetical protein U9R41_06300 [Candidatus Marinimicrobia bacterium]|nr:hypothetical protein [Candidatus Neomarinimicrobiota bacterium]
MDLVLTLDYELFGNGSGNVFQHMIEPTNKLLEICDKYNIKITLFFEVLEYLKIKETWDSGIDMGYKLNPAMAIEKQIKEAHKKGHDIQLHLHPQWLNAKYNNKWIVDDSLWQLPKIKKEDCGYSIDDLLKLGKDTIEDIIKPIDNGYQCNIFRAGGYNILPSDEVVKGMKKNGFVSDSSVYAGGYIDSKLSNHDYRSIKVKVPYWYIEDNNVLISGNKEKRSIIEFPIFAQPIRRIFKYDIQRLKVKLGNKKYALEQLNQKTVRKSKIGKIRYLFEKEVITWDYSLFTFRKLKRFYKKAKKIEEDSEYDLHPFVLVGHSKEFFYSKAFVDFIEYVKKDNANFSNLVRFTNKLN